MKPLLPVDEAIRRLLEAAVPVAESETLPLAECDGRVLSTDLTARLTQPPFDASAMDGYALRSADAADIGSVLTVIGQAAAGHAFTGTVGEGQAVRIFTGAPVPQGADTILIQEDAEVLEGGKIRTAFDVTAGRHIRPRGQDFTEGEAALKTGRELGFTELTLAAAMNHAALTVYRRPRIAILATGDELLPPGSAPQPAQIIASNTFGVAALARQAGAEVIDLGIVADNDRLIRAAIGKAVAANVDVLVTLGGASVGDHDLVQAALKAEGMQLDFWRIAMRPGKPLMVGAIGSMQVLGLPGNPVASLVCGLLFLEPLIRSIARRAPRQRAATARTATPLKANDHRQDYLRARFSTDENGLLVAEAHTKQDSSMMKILAHSDGLLVRPPNAPAAAAGTECPVIRLKS
ncbi:MULTISPECIES: molybdopterin molybdotransferase MoeA [Agrobacterium]|uniref:Molybdopterin molybdenumtransferase n=1 Tax=Agrobacterium salinitolerans TaxID=1183413 RepID=A0ABY3BSX7_9HYPH|nr:MULTISPECIES: gephyrin-like molybdotransferase Glp [Agrobacterium]PNQ24592.1 molybdopterin molybdenumtransferase MoeA [Rhizobium sp. YIC5082]MCZ7890861.1 molybdopterin molybdotransferase MoeA [Agrobacterium salinitolerans]MDA5639145.1 molybdopterin molybdotransferase MoeA [Agrobacterium sp. ST15.13.013]MDA6998920.1 molybdopterin molybdotransferase MoeA [Agrobacterium salinitolerans]OOO26409.1 molybdopterin molybdenumtransferase MoeA [Agrobacterium salinitolerans]